MQQGVHGHVGDNTADGSANNRHHLAHGVLELRRSCALWRGAGKGPGTRGQQRGETTMRVRRLGQGASMGSGYPCPSAGDAAKREGADVCWQPAVCQSFQVQSCGD